MGMLAGKTILLVEDEILVALAAKDMLEDLGAVVVGPATWIDEGLQLAETPGLAAAVVDINVRGQTSDAIVARLKARGTPVVLATGYNASDLDLGNEDVILNKPYTMKCLSECLSKVMASNP